MDMDGGRPMRMLFHACNTSTVRKRPPNGRAQIVVLDRAAVLPARVARPGNSNEIGCRRNRMIQFARMSLALKSVYAVLAFGCLNLVAETRILSNVTLIDGTGKAAQPGMSIEVTDGKITRIAKGKLQAANAQVMD